MSTEVADLYVTLRAATGGYTTGMTKAAAAGEAADSSMKKAMLASVNLAKGLGLLSGAAIVGSVALSTQFHASMERVATQAGASQAEVDKMSKAILAMAGDVAQSPNALAQGLFHIESAGFRGATALDMLKNAAKGATIGNAELESVTQAMIGTMAVGFKDVHGAGDAMAYMNQIVGTGDMKMQQLAASIATGVLPTFQAAGLQMRDYGSALATITDNVTPADEAATRLRMTVSMLAAPTAAATKHLAALGISQMQLAQDMRKPNGLLLAIGELKTAVDKQGKVEGFNNLVRAFGGGRSSAAIVTLVKEFDRLKSKYVELGNTETRAKKLHDAWIATQATLKYQVGSLQSSLGTLAVTIGDQLAPYVATLVGWVKTAVVWFTEHQGAAKALAITLATTLVGAIIAVGVAWAAATWEATLVVGAIMAVVGAVVYAFNNFKPFHDFVVNAWNDIQVTISNVVPPIVDIVMKLHLLQIVGGAVILVLIVAFKAWEVQMAVVTRVIAAIGDLLAWMAKGAISAIQVILDALNALAQFIGGDVADAAGMVDQAFQRWAKNATASIGAVSGDMDVVATQMQNLAMGATIPLNVVVTTGSANTPGEHSGTRIGQLNGAATPVDPMKAIQAQIDAMLKGLGSGGGGGGGGGGGKLGKGGAAGAAAVHLVNVHFAQLMPLLHSLGIKLSVALAAGLKKGTPTAITAVRDMVTNFKKAAQQHVADLKAAMKTMAHDIASTVMQSMSFTGAQAQGNNALTYGDVSAALATKVRQAQSFYADLKMAKKMGLAVGLLTLFAQAGPDAGAAPLHAIIAAGKGAVAQENSQYGLATAAANGIGGFISGANYNGQIASANAALAKDIKITNTVYVYLDGKQIHTSSVKHAQRHKKRSGKTGLT